MLSSFQFEDSLWEGLTDTYCNMPMALTAEKLGKQYKLSRADVDQFAYQSQTRWKAGKNKGLNRNFWQTIRKINSKVGIIENVCSRSQLSK